MRQFNVLRENGYVHTSLSVQKENLTVRFYQRLGYGVVDDKSGHAGRGDFIMIKDLGSEQDNQECDKIRPSPVVSIFFLQPFDNST